MKRLWLAVSAACLTVPGYEAAIARELIEAAPAGSLLASAPASTASPEPAARPAGLDCVRDRLSPDEWRALLQLALEQAPREDPRTQPLLRVVEACGNALSWSAEKTRLATMFTMSVAGVAVVRENLAGRGVRVEQLDQTILSDREFVAIAEHGVLDNAAGLAFTQRHADELGRVAAGQPLDGELGILIGNYIAFRVLTETLAAQFGRTP
jgi:hypothetical protein